MKGITDKWVASWPPFWVAEEVMKEAVLPLQLRGKHQVQDE
jgi:hypothetical protein